MQPSLLLTEVEPFDHDGLTGGLGLRPDARHRFRQDGLDLLCAPTLDRDHDPARVQVVAEPVHFRHLDVRRVEFHPHRTRFRTGLDWPAVRGELAAGRLSRSEACRQLRVGYATLLRLLAAEHGDVPAGCPIERSDWQGSRLDYDADPFRRLALTPK